jgi:DNA-binding transcriptional regulator YhcF (GntR family)
MRGSYARPVDPHRVIAGRRDLPGEIYRNLRAAILDGRIAGGERLPATRELAVRLDVSRSTVAAAYDRLISEGYATGRVGSGTYVEANAIDTFLAELEAQLTSATSQSRLVPPLHAAIPRDDVRRAGETCGVCEERRITHRGQIAVARRHGSLRILCDSGTRHAASAPESDLRATSCPV